MAQHFEDLKRTRRGPFGEQEIVFTAKDQMEGFKKSDFVCLNVEGKIMRHEILVYDGPSLIGNPRAADVVLDWAEKKGHRPILPAKEKEPLPHEHTKRIEHLERRIEETDAKIDKILGLLENEAIKKGEKK